MIIPIRCFTCGKPVSDKWDEYVRRVKAGEDVGRLLDDLGIKRYCCRRMLMSHVDVIDELLRYVEVISRKRSQAV